MIADGISTYRSMLPEDCKDEVTRTITVGADHWALDDDDEFLAMYRAGFRSARLSIRSTAPNHSLIGRVAIVVHHQPSIDYVETEVMVERPTKGEIERVLTVFERYRQQAFIPEPAAPPQPPPVVFIGHGGSGQWRDLKDHLHDHHGFDVEAYETGARAGHTIRDVLESMMERSTIAILVMTAEDEQSDGTMRARQNVVHEAGLFQGRLGFNRAIVAIEDGVETFSNLQGIHQLRYSRGNIREIFGHVVAAIRREFPT
jgi:hypothetical protein